MRLERLNLKINGVDRFVTCDPENDSLAEVLRRMGLTGVKIGCGTGVCGACSVLLDGEVVRSCSKKMKRVHEYSEITTIEGIGTPQHLHPLQQAWITYGGAQCGFCSPGFIVSAYGLLGMRYRVEAEHGTLAVTSAPGQGTQVHMRLPLATRDCRLRPTTERPIA